MVVQDGKLVKGRSRIINAICFVDPVNLQEHTCTLPNPAKDLLGGVSSCVSFKEPVDLGRYFGAAWEGHIVGTAIAANDREPNLSLPQIADVLEGELRRGNIKQQYQWTEQSVN